MFSRLGEPFSPEQRLKQRAIRNSTSSHLG